jgi:parallel beta-helix repeat protein
MRFVSIAVVVGVVGSASVAQAAAAHTIIVRPGESIQAAVDRASPGDRVLVLAGTYTEAGQPCPQNPSDNCAVVISKDDIALVGVPRGGQGVVLQNAGGQTDGIAIAKTGDPGCLNDPSMRVEGSLLAGLTVNGFDEDGVFLFCVDDWRVTHVQATANPDYGIFPSHSGAGRVDHSLASGANDTGVYVGQSHDVLVDHDVATGNVSGFEIENSTGVRMTANTARDNTGGILSFTLPFLDVKVNDHNRIDHNVVVDNNKPNTCEPGEDVCFVPVGSGIGLAGADHNTVDHNKVMGNDSFGVLVANVCNALQIPPSVCAQLDIDPNSDGTRVLFDRAFGNGLHPDPNDPLPGVDLAWDGTGTDNCWAKDAFGTSYPDPLPSCS